MTNKFTAKKLLCKNWNKGCKFGDACRFYHPKPETTFDHLFKQPPPPPRTEDDYDYEDNDYDYEGDDYPEYEYNYGSNPKLGIIFLLFLISFLSPFTLRYEP
jgi:hypothetical protein